MSMILTTACCWSSLPLPRPLPRPVLAATFTLLPWTLRWAKMPPAPPLCESLPNSRLLNPIWIFWCSWNGPQVAWCGNIPCYSICLSTPKARLPLRRLAKRSLDLPPKQLPANKRFPVISTGWWLATHCGMSPKGCALGA